MRGRILEILEEYAERIKNGADYKKEASIIADILIEEFNLTKDK